MNDQTSQFHEDSINMYLNINQVDAMRGPEIVAGVELEEDEEGKEKTGNPRYVSVHLVDSFRLG